MYVMPPTQLHLAGLQGSILPIPGRMSSDHMIPDVGITQSWAPAAFLPSRPLDLHLQALHYPGPLMWGRGPEAFLWKCLPGFKS